MNKMLILNNILTSIKTGYLQNYKFTYCKFAKPGINILWALYNEGLIVSFKKENNLFKIQLLYFKDKPFIQNIILIYKPSLKKNYKVLDIKKLYKKFDIFFISTPNGIVSSNNFIKLQLYNYNVGGQVLFAVCLNNNNI